MTQLLRKILAPSLLPLLLACGAKSDNGPKPISPPSPAAPGAPSRFELLSQVLEGGSKLHAPEADVAVCGAQKNKVIALERVDNQNLWKFEFDLGRAEVPAHVKAVGALRNLEKFDSARAQRLRNAMLSFYDRIEFFSLPEKKVANPGIALTPDCYLAQLASQTPVLGLLPKLYVNVSLWEKMAEDDRALFILRKTFETEVEEETPEPQLKARYFVAFLAGNAIPSDEKKNYLEFLRKLGFTPPTFIERNLVLYGDSAEYDADGKLRKAQVAADSEISTEYANAKVRKGDTLWFGADGRLEKASLKDSVRIKLVSCEFSAYNSSNNGNAVSFYSNGMLARAAVRDVCLPFGNQVKPFIPISEQDVSFYSTGVFKAGCLLVNETLPVAGTTPGQAIRLITFQGLDESSPEECRVEMHQNGFVKRGYLYEESQLMTSRGELKKYPARALVSFDETGRALDFE